jgi:DNA primase large subunit
MKPLHARYPFLGAAREAVEEAGVDLADLVATEEAVVERGLERIEWALSEGTVGEPHRRTRVELLSYPVARVLVSLVDEHVLLRKYGRAEATTAYERFTEELSATAEFQSTRTERLSLDALLREFDLAAPVHETGPDAGADYRVDVGAYLEYAADERGDEWRLVNRPLADGQVPIDEDELLVLCRSAVRRRVQDGLPFPVPDPIAEELTDEAEHVRELLADLDLTREIDTVVPDLFPPCMRHLLDQVQKGEHLEHHSRFAIAAFLTGIGMSTDEIVELFQVNPGFGEEQTRYQVDHIRGATSPTEYSTPACATMQSYGDCVGKDDICEDVINESHPLNYYEHRLDEADEEELVDWREGEEGEDGSDAGETAD